MFHYVSFIHLVPRKVKEKKAQRKHFHAGQIQDQELRKRFDKSKTLKQLLGCTALYLVPLKQFIRLEGLCPANTQVFHEINTC